MMQDRTGFFGGDFVNRVSFLREDAQFIHSCLAHESTRFVLLEGGDGWARTSDGSVFTVSRTASNTASKAAEAAPLSPQELHDHVFAKIDHYTQVIDTLRSAPARTGMHLTFLGLLQQEEQGKTEPNGNDNESFQYKEYRGVPYFAVNFASKDSSHKDTLATLIAADSTLEVTRITFKNVFELLSPEQSSLYSHARMYIDWMNKFNFCTLCGSPVFFIQGGTKWQCSKDGNDKSTSDGNEGASTLSCPLACPQGHNNVTFPRTDPVAIVAITNRDRSKMCLVRSKRKIGDFVMYSCVAGFMEPSETIEDACQREIWEETGIQCDQVQILKSQPWPYPASLMIGCIGTVHFNGANESINLTHDQELMDAQWFDTRDVATAIRSYKSGFLMPFGDDNVYLPGNTAIAFDLMKKVCDDFEAAEIRAKPDLYDNKIHHDQIA